MDRSGASRPTSLYSQASTSSCCSIDEGKREVRGLMDSFMADLQRTVRDNFSDTGHAEGCPAAPTASRSGVIDTDVEMTQPVPGAYGVEPATGAAPPAEEYIHKGIWCDVCNKQVTGIRHKCLDCYNFDLCDICMKTRDIQSTHADMPHTFQAMHPPQSTPPKPTVTPDDDKCLCSVLPRPLGCYICKPRTIKNKRSTRELTYRCDSCQNKITNTRHKCMVCPDFDLCDSCYSVGFPISDHSPVHRFMHIEDPIRIITAPAVRHESMLPLRIGCSHDGARYKCDSCGAVDACMNCLGEVERATIEHAAFHVEQGWDHPVRFTPYHREPKVEEQAPAVPARPTLVVHPAECDACDQTIVGNRHKCTVCEDLDLCDSCFDSRAEPLQHKTDHAMLLLDRPLRVVTHVVTSDENAPSHARPVSISATTPITPNVIHRAWCDGCSERIRGIRHKCLDCEDFDYCDKCVTKEHFNGQHEFYALVQPGEVVVRNVEPSDVRARGRSDVNVSRIPIPPVVPAPVAPAVPVSSQRVPRVPRPAQPAQHSAACDMCSSRIAGVRFKCVACPDYDVCQSCFNITEEVHPGHSFAKVHKQGDIVVRKSAQSSFRHHARCDACQKQIIGARYKCIHPSCPDFDICERCEALPIPVHPDTHAFIKVRTHITEYDNLKSVLLFAARGEVPRSSAASTPVRVPSPVGVIRILPSRPIGLSTEPTTATEMFHTASPSPIVPFSTLGCTIVPHTTIVPSLPQSPAPPSEIISVSPRAIPSPPPIPESLLPLAHGSEKSLADSWTAASSSAKLDEHVMHHSDMYKPSYEAPVAVRPVVEDRQPTPTPKADSDADFRTVRMRQLEEKRAKLRELKEARERRLSAQVTPEPLVRAVTVDEERDPEAPQMKLTTNSRPVSFPNVPAHEPEVVAESVAVVEFVAPVRVALPEASESALPTLVPTYAYPTSPSVPAVSVVAESVASGASTPFSSSVSVVSAASIDAALLSASFVEDKSIVDGQMVSGGAEFAKCWRMVNDGPAAWPKGTTISFVGGHSMLIHPDMVHWTIAGDFTPGQEIDVEVEMKAPEEPGRYVSFWRLKTPEGQAFGARVWCDIVVAEMERAGSAGSCELSASSIVMPTAPSVSAVSPTIHSLPSTVAPSVVDTDVESIGSLDSDDSAVWDEVRRQARAHGARSEGGDGFEVVYESD